MATSGSFNTNNPNYGYLTFSWQRTGYSIESNYSDISWKVVFTKSSSGWVNIGATSCTVNGSSKSAGRGQTWSGSTVLSGINRIYHNADGTKIFTASVSSAIYTYAQNTAGSGSFTLDTLPRATTPKVNDSSPDIEETIIITLPRASASFTHTLNYRCGSANAAIGTNVGSSKSWKIPELLYAQLTNVESKVLYIDCLTYSGSSHIGTKTISITIRVPTRIVPTISSVGISENNSAVYQKFRAFLQSKSSVKVVATASANKYATITHVVSTVESKQYEGSTIYFAPATSGTINIVTTVTDSRGRSASKTSQITVLPYSAPSIQELTSYRCDAQGNQNDKGTRVNTKIIFSISSVNELNDKSYHLETSKDGKTWTVLTSGNVFSFNSSYLTSSQFNTAYAYKIRLVIADYFEEVIKERVIPVGYTILNFKSNGRGFAVGKVSEKDGFEVDMSTDFYESVAFHKMPSGILNRIFPVGSVHIHSTNENPASTFGGKWTLFAKDWSDSTIEKTYYSSYASLETVAVRTASSLRLRIKVTLKQTIGETQVILGNIKWSDFGVVSDISYSLFGLIGASDGGNSLVSIYLDYQGKIESVDTYTSDLNSGDVFYINATINVIDANKADNTCNKFYFKRIN